MLSLAKISASKMLVAMVLLLNVEAELVAQEALAAAVEPGAVVAAWSQIVPNQNVGIVLQQASLELRFVVQGRDKTHCDNFALHATTIDGEETLYKGPLSARIGPKQVLTNELTKKKKIIVDLPVTLCSYAIPANWLSARLITKSDYGSLSNLPTVKTFAPKSAAGMDIVFSGPGKLGNTKASHSEFTLVTLGDTGCRGGSQDCNNDWSFGEIINSASGKGKAGYPAPDLVIHVGDFRYFNEGYTPDTWSYWVKDFFSKAQPLLLSSPWAFSRGNHEQCSYWARDNVKIWYGAGWLFLFGVDERACLDLDSKNTSKQTRHSENLDTWHFDISPGGIDDSGNATLPHRFVMVDTSSDSEYTTIYSNFKQAFAVNTIDSTWWVSHIPGVNLMHGSWRGATGDSRIFDPLTRARMDTGSVFCNPSNTPTCTPSTFILGHQHLFQQIEFFTYGQDKTKYDYPQRYIVGHGGVEVREANLGSKTCQYTYDMLHPIAGDHHARVNRKAQVTSISQHGYVYWKRNAKTASTSNSGWQAIPMQANGELMALPKPSYTTCMQR